MNRKDKPVHNGTTPSGYEKREDGWWILGFRCGDVGPYRTKEEAREGAQGLRDFYRYEWDERQTLLPAIDDVKWEPGQRRLFE